MLYKKYQDELRQTASKLCRRGRGLLAADESVGTIGKRLISLGLENIEENRRQFREILICAPGNEEAYSGIILFHETVYQKDSKGKRFIEILNSKGIIPGVKVDTGLKPVTTSPGETYTSGLEGLQERCETYYKEGIRFAKWRAALRIDENKGLPSDEAVEENANTLAKYASAAQAGGLMPIVEPEILIDGDHGMEASAAAAKKVINACYKALEKEGVMLEGTLLKPMMIMPGISAQGREDITKEEVAKATLDVMKEVVPKQVAGIMFLSGGMSEQQATDNLNALNILAEKQGNVEWNLSFSFGRALQTSAMKIWNGNEEMIAQAMEVAAMLGKVNARAQLGLYDGQHPSTGANKSLYEGYRGWRSGEDPKGV